MPTQTPSARYPPLLQFIHWAIALLFASQLTIAVTLGQLRSLRYGQLILGLHRQIGLAILLICILRLLVLGRRRAPPLRLQLPGWQIAAARSVHAAFYAALIVQPLLGMFVAWGRGDTLTAFGLVTLPAPVEISDGLRESLMKAHMAVAAALLLLLIVHVGAVVFNAIRRRVAVIERMLPPHDAHTLVNKVSVARQLLLAMGIVLLIAVGTGVNAIAKYREATRATALYQQGDQLAATETRAAQADWKAIVGIGAPVDLNADGAQRRAVADDARTNLSDAALHSSDPPARARLSDLGARAGALASGARAFSTAEIALIDTRLQDLVDSQSAAEQQVQADMAENAAQGHDLIVVTVAPMALFGIVLALALARSMSSSLARMRAMVQGIAADMDSGTLLVQGQGEFAALMRDMIAMRTAIQLRSQAAADHRAGLEAERSRFAEELKAKQHELERRKLAEQNALREQLAGEFESQVAGIVDSVALTVESLKSTAAALADSAAITTTLSADASAVAATTKNAASSMAHSSAQLSQTARSVRVHAQESKTRAVRGVQEATAAKAEIDLLADASHEIGHITDIITAVTRQTQLLAINARIEAARAGAAGRGFCVVADEVKSLAARTRDATTDIDVHTQKVGVAALRSIEILKSMGGIIAELDAHSANIFAACDGQSRSTEEIASRVREISASTAAVADNVVQTERTARATEGMARDLVDRSNVLQTQADALQGRVADFVLQLRSITLPNGSQTGLDTGRTAAIPLLVRSA